MIAPVPVHGFYITFVVIQGFKRSNVIPRLHIIYLACCRTIFNLVLTKFYKTFCYTNNVHTRTCQNSLGSVFLETYTHVHTCIFKDVKLPFKKFI